MGGYRERENCSEHGELSWVRWRWRCWELGAVCIKSGVRMSTDRRRFGWWSDAMPRGGAAVKFGNLKRARTTTAEKEGNAYLDVRKGSKSGR